MTTYFGKSFSKSFSFCLSCVSFANVYQFVCESVPFGFQGGIWFLIITFLFTLTSSNIPYRDLMGISSSYYVSARDSNIVPRA